MALALFDLDNTLLHGDSDYLWGRFLLARDLVDGPAFETENERFYRAYQEGTLDPLEYLRFALAPLARHDPEQLDAWRREFVDEWIRPRVLPRAQELVREHASRGDTTVIVTATNRFITEPIARLFEVEDLLATTPEQREGRYTGEVTGPVTFGAGKVDALEKWLAQRHESFRGSHFYSDSHNDLPLLERVDHPVAVDPDDILRRRAEAAGWPTISLR